MEHEGVMEGDAVLVSPGAGNRHRLAILRDHAGTCGRNFAASFGRGLGGVVVETFLRDCSDSRIARDWVVLAIVGPGILSLERLPVSENNISRGCKHTSVALEYSLFVSGRACQRTLYGICGGQPALQSAWEDTLLNELSDEFFWRTSSSIQTAYVRPQYPGYVGLQERAGQVIAEYCRIQGDTRTTLERVNALYRSSLEWGTFNV